MNTLSTRILTTTFALTAALSVGLIGCDKSSADSNAPTDDRKSTEPNEPNESEGDNEGVANLCTDYDSCDGCIAGQVDKGKSEGEAQTQCGLAATGCWTTWEKPVVCGETTIDASDDASDDEF